MPPTSCGSASRQLRRPGFVPAPPTFAAPRFGRIFRDGFLVALLNPKTALFFAAFLPQFIDPAGSAIAQSVALGSLFVAIAATSDAVYVIAAGAASPALSRGGSRRGWGRYLAAAAYFGLAALHGRLQLARDSPSASARTAQFAQKPATAGAAFRTREETRCTAW